MARVPRKTASLPGYKPINNWTFNDITDIICLALSVPLRIDSEHFIPELYCFLT